MGVSAFGVSAFGRVGVWASAYGRKGVRRMLVGRKPRRFWSLGPFILYPHAPGLSHLLSADI